MAFAETGGIAQCPDSVVYPVGVVTRGLERYEVRRFHYEALSLGLVSGTKLESASLIAIS